jgi:hypothetical protein
MTSYYYVCDACGTIEHRKPIPEGATWTCDCGSERAWEFTNARAAYDHARHIQRLVSSGLIRRG